MERVSNNNRRRFYLFQTTLPFYNLSSTLIRMILILINRSDVNNSRNIVIKIKQQEIVYKR